ncbi:MAG: LysR family transcriptional regulator [Lachnospiraceae bacterium]|nr:LysR family transcriptional regulator [Lachnospiraceae bacterium]
MDFRELTYVTMVAECKSVTAAAKKLYISQPSLSQILSKVEQDVGVKLFDRNASPITLTYAGEKYVETARRILSLNKNLRRELMDICQGARGKIRLGIPTERAGYMLPAVLKHFREQYPLVEVVIFEAHTDELIELMEKEKLDLFISPRRAEDLPAGMKAELIYQERLFLLAAPGAIAGEHCKNRKERTVDLAKLKDMPVILLKKGHEIRKRADAILKKHKIVPARVMEISSCISAVQLADGGLGYTFVPQRAVDVLGGEERFCCYHFSDKEESWGVHVVCREDAYLDRPERYLIDLMKETFRQV